MNSANLCSQAGRYDNPIPPRFLAHIDFTPNFELANARLADFSERELENYLCHHGPRRYDRNELRTIIAANMQPDIYPERIRLHKLTELIPWDRFLGSLKV